MANYSKDDLTPLSTPPSATHDTSRVSFHIRDLEMFTKELNNVFLSSSQITPSIT
jgi:hypothetical protein